MLLVLRDFMDLDENDQRSPNEIDEKDLMIIGDLIDKLRKIHSDQDSLIIVAELFINHNLKYNEILEKTGFESEKLDSILKFLIDSDLVNVKDQEYTVAVERFQNLINNTNKFNEQAQLLRESRIFNQTLFQTLLTREMKMLETISSDEYQNQFSQKNVFGDYRYLGYQFINKEIFLKYQKKLQLIYEEFYKEIAEYEKKNPVEKPEPFFMYFGYLFFPELEKKG